MKKNILFLLIAVFIFAGCSKNKEQTVPASAEMSGGKKAADTQMVSLQVDMLAVGDNLIHEPIYKEAAERAGGKGYDFKPAYLNVKADIAAADIAFINQETIIAGTSYKPSSYPSFNSPVELGNDMAELGFDIVSHANNHMLDKGAKGLEGAIAFWSEKPQITLIGAYRNKEDALTIRYVEKNGLKFAFLAYTYGTNGISLPASSGLFIPYIDSELMIRQITEARGNADVVVIAIHWGNENTTIPTAAQRQLAQSMSSAGADIILGHHPHVLQPVEYLTGSGGNTTLVYYSLGNFISAQVQAANLLGGMAKISMVKEPGQSGVKITSASLVPIVTHYETGMKKVAIYPLAQYTKELSEKNACRKMDSKFSLAYLNKVLADTIPTQFLLNN